MNDQQLKDKMRSFSVEKYVFQMKTLNKIRQNYKLTKV